MCYDFNANVAITYYRLNSHSPLLILLTMLMNLCFEIKPEGSNAVRALKRFYPKYKANFLDYS